MVENVFERHTEASGMNVGEKTKLVGMLAVTS